MSERRRLVGPPNTIIPSIGISSSKEDETRSQEQPERAPDELRKFFLKTGIIDNANGSAYLEIGNTIIEVLVFGPRPIRGSFVERASFSAEVKFLPYITQPHESSFNNPSNNQLNAVGGNSRTGLSNIEQRISSYLETSLLPSIVLEKYPKSTIDVFVTIISTEKNTDSKSSLLNLVSWIVNCSSLALVDSGIELKDIVTSGHVKLVNGDTLIDVPDSEEEGVDALVSFMNMRNDEIVGLWFEGDASLQEDVLTKVIDSCNDMAKRIRANVNSYLLNSIQ